MTKAGPDVDAEILARVAELFYLHHWSREQIAAELSKERHRDHPYDPSRVNQWLSKAESLNVVTFDIDPSFALEGSKNEMLADRLRKAFGIEEPIVVDVDKAALQDPKAADLHTTLANQTGMRLSQIPSSKTRFFVAGGRAVVQVARKIKRQRPPWSNVHIDPLSGRNWTGNWQVDGPDDLERPLDADDAAIILASAFPKSGTRFSQIGHPLYMETAQRAGIVMREHCAFLPDGEWNWDVPHPSLRAICGIGALHPMSGHRIMRFLEIFLKAHGVKGPEDLHRMINDGSLSRVKLPKTINKSAHYLSSVAIDLIVAIAYAGERRLGYFGDIANRLYPCLPLPDQCQKDGLPSIEDYKQLITKLDALNHRAVVMQWSHLRRASAWVTAGGALKLEPIWTLAITRYIEKQKSNRDDSIINQLTTDSVTAQGLLNALDSFKKSSGEIQRWYTDLTDILFQ